MVCYFGRGVAVKPPAAPSQKDPIAYFASSCLPDPIQTSRNPSTIYSPSNLLVVVIDILSESSFISPSIHSLACGDKVEDFDFNTVFRPTTLPPSRRSTTNSLLPHLFCHSFASLIGTDCAFAQLNIITMKISAFSAILLLLATLSAAWPWPEAHYDGVKAFEDVGALLFKRQNTESKKFL